MNIEKVRKNGERKSVLISIRVTPFQSKWMKEHRVSPTKVFQESLKELIGNTKEVEEHDK